MRVRIYVQVAMACVLLSAAAGRAATQKKTAKAKAVAVAYKNRKIAIWEKAAEAYKTAMNVYRLGDWQKGSEALAVFIKKYSTSENVPLAYLQLADCQFRMETPQAAEATLDALIKKFPASKAIFYAYSYKLDLLLKQNERDNFLKHYQDFIKMMGVAPMELHDRSDWRKESVYYRQFKKIDVTWPYKRQIGYELALAPKKFGWAQNLLKVGNTSERAAKLLKILEGSYKKLDKNLPVEWKFVRILLLRKTGRGKQADNLYNKYLHDWPKGDPRRMGLMLFEAEWAQAQPILPRPVEEKPDKKKVQPVDYKKRADEIYDSLMKKYPGWTTLGARLPKRIQYLHDQQRCEEFRKLALWYLDKFPTDSWRAECISLWVDMVKEAALSDNTSHIASAMKLLEEEARIFALNPQVMRRNFLRRIELYMTLSQAEKATGLARDMMSKKYWSSETFSQLVALAGRYDSLKEVEIAARKKYGIPIAVPNSKARELFDKLKKRIATEKVRHMEEIGEEMFEKYQKDAYTIEAMKLLVEYFFNKALYKQRDKWSNLMIKAYRYHPSTQAVMMFLIKAQKGARNFPRLASLTEQAMKSFPAAKKWNQWFSYRVKCFKDSKEALEYLSRKLKARAKAGEIFAISWIGKVETKLLGTGKQKDRGDYWMARARKFSGKQQEIYCIERAFEAYYLYPARLLWRNKVDFQGAAKAIRAMQSQTLLPELRWKTQFDDINIMAQAGSGRAVIKALTKRLKTNKLSSHLRDLLDLANIGMAIGNEKASSKASRILSQLKARCKKDKQDKHEYLILKANMFRKEKRNLQAASAYLQAARFYARPIDRWKLEINAIKSLAGTQKYAPVISKYAASINSAQDAVPRLLLLAGSLYAKKADTKKQAMGYLMKLRKKYPASSQRGKLEAKIK